MTTYNDVISPLRQPMVDYRLKRKFGGKPLLSYFVQFATSLLICGAHITTPHWHLRYPQYHLIDQLNPFPLYSNAISEVTQIPRH